MGISVGGAVIPEMNCKYISSTTLSADAVSLDIVTDFNKDGIEYLFFGTLKYKEAAASGYSPLLFRINSSDANFIGQQTNRLGSSFTTGEIATNYIVMDNASNGMREGDEVTIWGYIIKNLTGYNIYVTTYGIGSSFRRGTETTLRWNKTDNITSIKFVVTAGNLYTGSTINLYALNKK